MNNKNKILNEYKQALINKHNKQALSDKDYKYFVVNINDNQILSGWEYKEDAIDDLKENQLQIWLHNNIKVYTRRFTTKLIK